MGASKKNIKEADASRQKILKSLDLLPDDFSHKEVCELLDIDEKARAGRPTKCTKTLLKKFIVHMAQGKSAESAAILCKVTPGIVSQWKDPDNQFHKPEFLKAIKVGEALQKLWWDEIGRKNLHTKDFNNTLYMMIRQNMHGWTRRLDGKIEVKEEHKTTHEIKVNFEFDQNEIKEYLQGLIEYGIVKQAENGNVQSDPEEHAPKAH